MPLGHDDVFSRALEQLGRDEAGLPRHLSRCAGRWAPEAAAVRLGAPQPGEDAVPDEVALEPAIAAST